MANVSIKFNGKEFLLSCEDGQEDHLEELLIQINQKFNNLKNDLGNLGENKLLLITAVKVMDEYHETKKKVDQKKDELKNLSNKFKLIKINSATCIIVKQRTQGPHRLWTRSPVIRIYHLPITQVNLLASDIN